MHELHTLLAEDHVGHHMINRERLQTQPLSFNISRIIHISPALLALSVDLKV